MSRLAVQCIKPLLFLSEAAYFRQAIRAPAALRSGTERSNACAMILEEVVGIVKNNANLR